MIDSKRIEVKISFKNNINNNDSKTSKKFLVNSLRKNYKHLVNSEEYDLNGIKVYRLARNKFY